MKPVKEWNKSNVPNLFSGKRETLKSEYWVKYFIGKLFANIGLKYFTYKGKYMGKCTKIRITEYDPYKLKIKLEHGSFIIVNTLYFHSVEDVLKSISTFDTESDAKLFSELDETTYTYDWYTVDGDVWEKH